MQKRNNGNGLWGACAGQGSVPVASNVVGTSYANFFANTGIAAPSKTGDINFYWPGVTNITELYVITRVWVGSTILATKVGPPPVPEVRNGNTYATYCFYVVNLPNAGVLTLEFTNPVTNQPAYLCSYDLKTGVTVSSSPVSCAPTINTQPQSKTVCSDTTSFRVSAGGVSSYQWQISPNGTSWSNITGAPFSGFNTAVLNIGAPASAYNNYQFRVVLTGAGTCGSVISSVATLTAYLKPTATFAAGAIVCGIGTYNLRVDLTGTAPYSFTYTTNGGSPQTVSSITSSPYYLAVSPGVTTTYAITALNDRYCANYSVSAPVTIVVQAKPTITLSASTIYACYSGSATTASLVYSGTANSPTQYSITAGSRAMPSFSAVSNAALGSSPITVNIPAGTAAGTYDFNLRVKVASPSPGCESDVVPFTLVVRPAPALSVSSSASTVCLNGSVTLTASPDLSGAGGHTYLWTGATVANSTAASTTATVTASPSTYTVTVTQTSTGCTTSGSTTVTSKAGANISVNNATICLGDKAILTASGGVTYSWSLAPGSPAGSTAELSSTSGSSVLATPTTATTRIFRVTGTSTSGCSGTADATITVNTAPTVSISSSYNICQGGSVTLTATTNPVSGPSLQWAPISSTASSVSVSPTTPTVYTVVATNGGCTGQDTQRITVYSPPIVNAPPRYLYHCGSLFTGQEFLSYSFSTSTNVTCDFQYFDGTNWLQITATSSGGNAKFWRSNAVGTSASDFTLNIVDNGNNFDKYRVALYYGTCTTYYYTDLIDLAATTPVFSPISSQNLCSGSTPTALSINGTFVTGTGTSTTPNYQWQVSTDSINFTNISGATNPTYQPGVITSNTWYRVGVSTALTCTTIKYSGRLRIIVTSASGNTISPDACISGPATLTGSAVAGATYSWESSTNNSTWVSIPGATGQNYTSGATLTQKTLYRRTAINGSCTTVSSPSALTPSILSNQIAGSYSLCSGASATALGPVTLLGGDGSYSYQWQSSPTGGAGGTWTNVGTNSNNHTPLVNSVGITWYRLVVTSGSCTSTSNESSVTVNALPTTAVTPASASVCNGATATLTASGAYTYSWTPSTGLDATTGAVVKATPTSTQTYTVTGTDANGCVDDQTVIVTVNSLPAAPTSSTGSSSACYPPAVNLTTTFISSSAPGGVEYKWFTESTNPPVLSTAVLNDTVSTGGTYYAFARNTTTGCFSSSSISASLTLVDNRRPTPLSNSFTACAPAAFNLASIEPTASSGTTWQWQTSSTYDGSNISKTVSSSGTFYLFGRNGTCTTAASDAVVVTINPQPLVNVTAPTESACSPNTVNLNNNYTVNAGEFYQWYTTNNPQPIYLVEDPGNIAASGTYYLYATNTTTVCQSGTPGSVTVTINTPPTVTITAPNLVCAGSSVSIASTASSSTFQWYYVNTADNSINLISGSPYSGETTNTLTINPVTSTMGNYLYYVRATSSPGGCPVNSDMVPVFLETPVSCTSGPANSFVGTLPNGTYFSFNVSDVNSKRIVWQVSTNNGNTWRNINGTTGNNATLYYGFNTTRLELLTVNDSMNNFRYRAVVSDSVCTGGGCTTSVAILTTPISLPVSGVVLRAQPEQNQLMLIWVAYNEQDVAYYNVQFSTDGRVYKTIDRVLVPQPSFTVKEYQVIVSPSPGFYRIEVVGQSENTAYSNLVYYNSQNIVKTGIYPNPASAEVSVNVSGLSADVPAECSIYSVEGRLLQKTTLFLHNGANTVKLSEAVKERSLVLLRIHQSELGEMIHTKLMIAR